MTMDFTEKEVALISERLKSHPVTYHTVARDLGISMSRSKKLLVRYYQSNKSTIGASFIATGTRHGIIVVHNFNSESALEENIKSTFDDVLSVQIYCIHLKKSNFTPVEIALEELRNTTTLDKLSEFHNLGLIKGPELSRYRDYAKGQTDQETKRLTPARNPVNANKSSLQSSSKPSNTSKSSKPASKPTLISSYVSRKGEISSSMKKRPNPEKKPTYQYKSRKIEQSEPKERVVVSSVDEGNDDDAKKMTAKVPTSHSDLHNLFLDDDFTDDEEITENKERSPEEESQPIAVDVETVAEPQKVDAPKIPEGSILKAVTSKSNETGSELREVQEPPPQETTIDEDGYFTLYKQTDPEPKKPVLKKAPQQVKAPPKSSSAKGDSKKKQASLMSFFGKR